MNTFRHSAFPLRALLAALLMVGWLLASNHCALGFMAAEPQAAACPGCHANGAEKPAPAGGIKDCCHTLLGVPADTSKTTVHYDATLFTLIVFTVFDSEPTAEVATRVCATGPPEARSFSELVLQRSLHSHAPPVRA